MIHASEVTLNGQPSKWMKQAQQEELYNLHITHSNLFIFFMDCHNPKGFLVHKYNLFSFHVTLYKPGIMACKLWSDYIVINSLEAYSINYDTAWDGKPTHSSIICNHIYVLSSLRNEAWTAKLASDFPYLWKI